MHQNGICQEKMIIDVQTPFNILMKIFKCTFKQHFRLNKINNSHIIIVVKTR